MSSTQTRPGMEDLIRSHLRDVKTYEPVDPPEVLAKRAGIPADKVIKLNGNENPFGSAPEVVGGRLQGALPRLSRPVPAVHARLARRLHRR